MQFKYQVSEKINHKTSQKKLIHKKNLWLNKSWTKDITEKHDVPTNIFTLTVSLE